MEEDEVQMENGDRKPSAGIVLNKIAAVLFVVVIYLAIFLKILFLD